MRGLGSGGTYWGRRRKQHAAHTRVFSLGRGEKRPRVAHAFGVCLLRPTDAGRATGLRESERERETRAVLCGTLGVVLERVDFLLGFHAPDVDGSFLRAGLPPTTGVELLKEVSRGILTQSGFENDRDAKRDARSKWLSSGHSPSYPNRRDCGKTTLEAEIIKTRTHANPRTLVGRRAKGRYESIVG